MEFLQCDPLCRRILRIAPDIHVVQMNDEIFGPELLFGMAQQVCNDIQTSLKGTGICAQFCQRCLDLLQFGDQHFMFRWGTLHRLEAPATALQRT